MTAAKECTKTDPKDAKILALKNRLSKLDKNKNSLLATIQVVGGNITHTHTNTKGMGTQQ